MLLAHYPPSGAYRTRRDETGSLDGNASGDDCGRVHCLFRRGSRSRCVVVDFRAAGLIRSSQPTFPVEAVPPHENDQFNGRYGRDG